MKYRRKEKEMKNLKRGGGNSGAPKKVDRSCNGIQMQKLVYNK
jgi:hypothetical protein